MKDISAKEISFQSRDTAVRGYLARPFNGDEKRAAVVVAHEWWGLTDHIKEVTRRFAEEGYIALAPNLYSRAGNRVTNDLEEASSLMSSTSSQFALYDLNAAVDLLKSYRRVDPYRIGLVGFSMGAALTLTMATHNSDIKAVVPFYGKIPPIESLNYLLCPVQYHYGAKDEWVTTQEVTRLQTGLEKFKKPGEVHIYPEANHAFFNDTRPEVYAKESADQAWGRTLEFLSNQLR